MPENTTDYLLRLSDALADVPREVRTEIVAGVREELEGLDEEQAAARIRELGDPEFIAAGAREEIPAAAAQPGEARWLSITASILVMVGGAAVPFVGWIAGIALMWNSSVWSKREKWIVMFAPAVAGIFVGLMIAAAFTIRASVIDSGYEANPLLPAAYDVAHTFTIVPLYIALPVAFFTGIWMLVTASRRRA